MGVFAVIIIVSTILLVKYTDFSGNNNNNTNEEKVIELEDSAIFHYKLWIDTNGDGDVMDDYDENNPYKEDEIYPTFRYDSVLANGFVDNVLGMQEGETDYFFIYANIDEDGDGLDDNTGDPIKGYVTGELKNTTLFYWVDILNITKKGEPPINTLPIPATINNQANDLSTMFEILQYAFLDEF